MPAAGQPNQGEGGPTHLAQTRLRPPLALVEEMDAVLHRLVDVRGPHDGPGQVYLAEAVVRLMHVLVVVLVVCSRLALGLG